MGLVVPAWEIFSLWCCFSWGSCSPEGLARTWGDWPLPRGQFTAALSTLIALCWRRNYLTFLKAKCCIGLDSAKQTAAAFWLCYKNKHKVAYVVLVWRAGICFGRTCQSSRSRCLELISLGEAGLCCSSPQTSAPLPVVLRPPGPNAVLSFSHQRLLSETGGSMPNCAVFVSKATIQARIVEHKICFRKAVQCSFLCSLWEVIFWRWFWRVSLQNEWKHTSPSSLLNQNPLTFAILMDSQKQTWSQMLENVVLMVFFFFFFWALQKHNVYWQNS